MTLATSMPAARDRRWSRLVRWALRSRLQQLRAGAVTVTLPDGSTMHHRGERAGPEASLVVHRWRTLWNMLSEGDLGLASAFINGDCSCPDLKALIELGAHNEAALARKMPGSWLMHALNRVRHFRRSNTRRGSRRNIAAHYDLGNAFYAQWLDPGMQYSSALYSRPGQSLEEAQQAKLRRVAELLQAESGQRVLEIGCGWGALAEHLVKQYGCAVTGLTLSTEQLAYARSRLRGSDTCELRQQDYRDVDGGFDRIVSIEMLEAVGERYWPTYFSTLRQSLVDGGVAVLQVITIAEQRFATYRDRPDFIQRYIFPGGMLPTAAIVRHEAERAGLRLVEQQDFGPSYARTLADWRRRFLRGWPQIEALGFDLRFKRMWEYYLTYCEVGFERAAIDVSLFKLRTSCALVRRVRRAARRPLREGG